MSQIIPIAGSISTVMARNINVWWQDEAARAGIDLSQFNAAASLESRLQWAAEMDLDIAGALSRYSSKLQHSTEAQLRVMVEFAATHRMYVPHEYVCVDEAEKGRQQRRDGLERMKHILGKKLVKVLLLFKVSRLFRLGYKGFAFVQENVVDAGMRAISVTQGIDTQEQKTWRALLYLHGLMDDLLLETIADHCRAGLESLFMQGFTTGAVGVGYKAVEIPGAPLTNRGLPRTRPAIDEQAAKLIVEHFEWIRDGMPISEGHRRWLKAGGPCDPRSTLGYMSLRSYRSMLSNSRLTGLWAFGRKRNTWSATRDYSVQVDQPETEVKLVKSEELRIVSDELFLAVQLRLNKLKKGPQGPRPTKEKHLWDLVTALFCCASCSASEAKVRFYQTGCRGEGMQCKRGALCLAKGAVRRNTAVQAVCVKLQERIREDRELIRRVVTRVGDIDMADAEDVAEKLGEFDQKISTISKQIEDLFDLAGHGSDEDRQKTKSRIRLAQAERSKYQTERSQYEGAAKRVSKKVTPEEVENELEKICELLDTAAAGKLGEDVVYKAASIFEQLVGGTIWVHVEPRPGRKAKNVRATFYPDLIGAFYTATDTTAVEATDSVESREPVEVWLREPPYLDRMAASAYQLTDIEGLSYREAAKVFKSQGHDVNSGKVWQFRKRYFEMIGQPMRTRSATR